MKPNSEDTYNQGERKANLNDPASPAVPFVNTDAAGDQHQSYINERNPCLPLAAEFDAVLPPDVDHERCQPSEQKQDNNPIQ